MGHNDDSISRRKFLEQAGAVVGVAALGNACGSDDTGPEQPSAEAPGAAGSGNGPGAAGTTSQAGSGAAGAGGTPAGAAGTRAGASGAGSGGRPSTPAAGSGGAGGTAPQAGDGAAGSGEAGAQAAAGGGAPPTANGTVSVGIVSVTNIDEAVVRAVELAGGLAAIQPGQTVFIKVNAVSDRALGMPGIRTANDMIAAVVKLVKTRMPGKIIVGDRSARQFPDTARVFAMTGMGEAAMMAGADEVYAARSPTEAPDEWMLLQPEGFGVTWQSAGGLYAMRKILEADHLINVPTMKNHRYALFSLSMKNFMGAIGDSTRDPVHFADSISGSFGPIGRDLAIINRMFKPMMNIIDGRVALVNGGPQGDSADAVRTMPGLVLASSDRLAIDAAAVSVMQLELETATVPTPDAANATLKREAAWRMPQIMSGIENGIGVASAEMVTLAFENVMRMAEIEAKFRA